MMQDQIKYHWKLDGWYGFGYDHEYSISENGLTFTELSFSPLKEWLLEMFRMSGWDGNNINLNKTDKKSDSNS